MTAQTPAGVEGLAARIESETGFNNELDVLAEIALFEPDDIWRAIRANAAGTKIICTDDCGGEKTFIARDFTISAAARQRTVAALRARAQTPQ